MHRNQKASPFSLNCGVFFKPILYFPEGFEVNLQVDLSGGKKNVAILNSDLSRKIQYQSY